MGVHPHGCLGDTKAHRKIIIRDNAEKFKFPSYLRRKYRVAPVRDGLGILHFLQSDYAPVFTAILSLWLQLECGQAKLKKRTINAEKPPKKAVFLKKVVRVTGFEPAASCSQSRRATNCATPGYLVFYPAGRILPNHAFYQLNYTRIFNFCHDTTANGKNKVFSVCGHSCGQSRFCAAFGNQGKSRKRRCRKALRRFALPYPGYNHGTPKPGAIPTSLYPDTFSVYHSCGWKGRENFWFT